MEVLEAVVALVGVVVDLLGVVVESWREVLRRSWGGSEEVLGRSSREVLEGGPGEVEVLEAIVALLGWSWSPRGRS